MDEPGYVSRNMFIKAKGLTVSERIIVNQEKAMLIPVAILSSASATLWMDCGHLGLSPLPLCRKQPQKLLHKPSN